MSQNEDLYWDLARELRKAVEIGRERQKVGGAPEPLQGNISQRLLRSTDKTTTQSKGRTPALGKRQKVKKRRYEPSRMNFLAAAAGAGSEYQRGGI